MRQASIGFALVSFLGCSPNSGSVTRASTKALIEQTKDFQAQRAEIELTTEEFAAGEQAGYFHRGRAFGENYFNLTPTGSQFFDVVRLWPGITLKTKTNVRRVVEITGIADDNQGGTEKEVKFTWGWNLEDFPPGLRPVFQEKPKHGTAELRRYDDGWRVDRIVPY
jgi:hypothetical protein